MNRLLMPIKRFVRRVMPDTMMAKHRVAEHSFALRENVDVFIKNQRSARRWLHLTPDTYRVIVGSVEGDGAREPLSVGEEDASLESILGFQDLDVVVAADALAPSMKNLRIVEPSFIPTSIVALPDALDEIGGKADNAVDLVRTYQRFADSGRRIGLVPTVVDRLPKVDRLPISIPAAVVFAGVPLHDVGGGSRAAQIALELLESGFHVTYVSLYPADEGIDLGIRYIHRSLEQFRRDNFDPDDMQRRAQGGIVILETPAEPFLEPAKHLQDQGWKVVYDIIDDWTDPALGGVWFNAEVEQELVGMADAVVASAPDLVAHGNRLGSDTALIPNAVNTGLFGPDAAHKPVDMPPGDIIGYMGSLYGSWFDWDQLLAVALAFPESTVVIIGDDRYQREMPTNVLYLGLKAQTDLPGYVQRFDVGIVPFVISDATHAVSPLKVYEYLASGVPVAAPPLRALDGLDGVYTDVDLVEAVRAAKRSDKPDRSIALKAHSWNERITRLVAAAGEEMPRVTADPVVVERRVPIHYNRSDRWIRLL